MQTITGFAELDSVGLDFRILNNDLLATLPTFATITSIGNDFTVTGNTALSSCCALLRFVDGTVDPSGTTDISGNGTGCSSKTEITDACSSASLTITQDSDVPDNVTEVTRITGNLSISGTISSFPDFAALEVVEGNLVIDNITMGTLTALSDIFPELDSVYGNLQIQNQSVVATIAGFASLDTIGRNLRIDNNTSLRTIPPFVALETVGQGLGVAQNDVLADVSGFGALTHIENNFLLTNNDLLATVSGFGCACDCGKRLYCFE